MAPKNMSYLGINLTKQVKDLNPKNDRTRLKETEEDKEMANYSMLMDPKNEYWETSTWAIYTKNAIPIKNTTDSLQRAGTHHLKICVESERTPNGHGNGSQENHSGGQHNAGFQVALQSCAHQDSVVQAQKQTQPPMEQKRNPEVDPQLDGQDHIFDQAGETIRWNKDKSLP